VANAGGFVAQYNDIDKVTAHHGDNHVPLLARHFRNDRAAMLAMVGALGLAATSADHSVLDLLEHVRTHAALTRDYIPGHILLADEAGTPLLDVHGKPRVRVFDTSFATENWNKAIRDRAHPGMFVRRHLEACVLTYLAEELRTGDVAVEGAQSYASWADQLISVERCAQLLPTFCAEVGLPDTAQGFREALQSKLAAQCAATEAGYPDNTDLVIDEAGRPSLKQYRAPRPTESALALEAALRARMPERTLLGCWPAPRTGWNGTAGSARPRARTRNWSTRSSDTCSPPSATARIWARRRPPATSPGYPRTSSPPPRAGT
jgi:hypothetical protein